VRGSTPTGDARCKPARARHRERMHPASIRFGLIREEEAGAALFEVTEPAEACAGGTGWVLAGIQQRLSFRLNWRKAAGRRPFFGGTRPTRARSWRPVSAHPSQCARTPPSHG
jgi:hypothetical protein